MRWLLGGVLIGEAAVIASPAPAAQVFVQPSASVSAESDSNLDLTPGGQPLVEGYEAIAASLIGIATPNSETNFKPRIDYRNYPTDAPDNRVEEYMDFNSFYKNLRTSAGITGTLDHRDLLSAELTPAVYNELNPNQPIGPETGRTVIGGTRDSAMFQPNYSYKVAPLWSVGVSGIYEKINYSPNDSGRFVDFDYYQAKLFTAWTVTQKSDLVFGAYGDNFEATRYDSRSHAAGGSVELNTSWSPLLSTSASVVFQRADIYDQLPPAFSSSVNTWGGSLSAIYKSQTTQFRTDLSRQINPSGGGSVYVNDQLHFEYDRRVTARLSFTAATVALRNRALTVNAEGDGRDYLRSLLEGKWMMTRTWYVQGGYQYFWEKYQLNPDGAANNRFYIRFGYQALGRQW